MKTTKRETGDSVVRMNMSVLLPLSQKIEVDSYFTTNPKFNKGQFVLEAILEKIEHEKLIKEVHGQRRS